MPAKITRKRDNSYYLERLKREAPSLFRDLRAGKFSSPAEAFKAAGFKRSRTRLHELKNGWDKASERERTEFLEWLGRKVGKPKVLADIPPLGGSVPIAVDGVLTSAAAAHIQAVLTSRNLKIGEAMQEMGFSKLDASVGRALSRPTRLRTEVVEALQKWLADNCDIEHDE